jgi:hypothetical protein
VNVLSAGDDKERLISKMKSDDLRLEMTDVEARAGEKEIGRGGQETGHVIILHSENHALRN